MEADWDILIILDGCRYDIFTEESTLAGETESILSAGSDSLHFMDAYFHGRQHHDTVYVSANPFTNRLKTGTFHDIYNVYNTHWDEDLNTVRPESMAEVACKAASQYPNKRIIVHFMQPHYPFFYTLQDLPSNIEESADSLDNIDEFWMELRNGDLNIPPEVVQRAYEENLKRALDSVRRIVSEMQGKTVITSDHGNLIGDRGFPIPTRSFGHPPSYYLPSLVNVPWLIIDGDRREIYADPPVNKTTDNLDKTTRQDRLESLGYL